MINLLRSLIIFGYTLIFIGLVYAASTAEFAEAIKKYGYHRIKIEQIGNHVNTIYKKKSFNDINIVVSALKIKNIDIIGAIGVIVNGSSNKEDLDKIIVAMYITLCNSLCELNMTKDYSIAIRTYPELLELIIKALQSPRNISSFNFHGVSVKISKGSEATGIQMELVEPKI